MALYNIKVSHSDDIVGGSSLFTIGFGEPANNTDIVREVHEMPLMGCGILALISGPASLPVAFVLAHKLAHRYGAIGIFDPKMSGFVIAVSHNPDFKVGDLIPMGEEE